MTAEIITVTNYLNGRFVSPGNADYLPVMNPGLGTQIARVPLSAPSISMQRSHLPGPRCRNGQACRSRSALRFCTGTGTC